MSRIVLEKPYKTFLALLNKLYQEDESYDTDIAFLSSKLRMNDQLRIRYIQYVLNNRHTFTPEKFLFNNKNITHILSRFQEEAVPMLQPSLLNSNDNVQLPPSLFIQKYY